MTLGTNRGRGNASLSEAQLRAILDAALDAVVTMADDGTVTTWNPQAETMFGWPAAEVIGRNLADIIIPPSLREAHHQGLARFLETGEGPILGHRIEVTALHRDGREFPVELTVTPLRLHDGWRFSAFIRDLTERRRAEAQLRANAVEYRLLFESNPEAMWVFDTETLRFLAVNEAAVQRYGYSREEFLTMSILDIRLSDERELLLELRRDQRDGPRTYSDLRHRRKDSTIISVEVLADSLEFRGRPARLVLAKDVTDQRRLEEQLRQVQKMEAVGRLAGGVAHDFNNLLTAIGGSTEFLLEALDAGDRRRADVEVIKEATERAAGLTRQLLAFSRQQVLEPEILDLNTLLQDSEQLLRRLIGEDVEVRCVLAPSLGTVRADPVQLQQVVLNLAVNARDAMPDGGTLTMETQNVELDAEYTAHHSMVRPGPYILLAVSDTGIGMDEETKARIFEPFFTTKSLGSGTGLGLAMVYGIVKQSGGFVWVYSELGRGTIFKIYLPRAGATVVSAGPAARATISSPPNGSETILLVEDEESVRKLAYRTLTARGYTVLGAASGTMALQLAASHSMPIQLLATDVIMPGMSGRELAERLRAECPGLKVLYLSGYTNDAIVHHGVLEQGVAFLQKPFSPDMLARKVRETLDAIAP